MDIFFRSLSEANFLPACPHVLNNLIFFKTVDKVQVSIAFTSAVFYPAANQNLMTLLRIIIETGLIV